MTPDEAGDLERARSIAVSLEQENARLTEINAGLRHMVIYLTKFAGPDLLDDGDEVGVESLPVGDPWAEVADGWERD